MTAVPAGRAPILTVVGLILVPVVFHFIIVATGHVSSAPGFSLAFLFRFSFVTVSAIMHWAIYSGLLVTFAVTLRPGREALLTSMARKLHGTLSDEVAVYTRQATFAWCLFFAAQLTASVTLFFFGPLVVWSFFVNVLDIPLVATMFAAEYVFRLYWLKNPPRQSLAAIVGMIASIRKPREEWAGSP